MPAAARLDDATDKRNGRKGSPIDPIIPATLSRSVLAWAIEG